MHYHDEMVVLSRYGMGAVLLDEHDIILDINPAADRMLHGKNHLKNTCLRDIAPELCDETSEQQYCNIAFGEYLIQCPCNGARPTGIPRSQRLITFRDASKDACHDMLLDICNNMRESIALYDQEGRLYMLNDATVRMESLNPDEFLGMPVQEIYQTTASDTSLVVPTILKEKRAILDHRQYYSGPSGIALDIVTNSYPIVQNGQLIGVSCIMDDYSEMDNLHKQVINLQQALVDQTKPKRKKKNPIPAQYHFKDIIHISNSIEELVTQCKRIAKGDSNIMIYGETGTGKELFAQSIHNASHRSDFPFLAINCAAIPETLLESLLFGTTKGSYTGAVDRPGLFEQADRGTLLLDEINSMPLPLQSKLLRVLQEGTLRRVGGSEDIRVNVRVISNINEPPEQAIEHDKLRLDLYYRLGVVNIDIPALRDRPDDIYILAKHFIRRCNKKMLRTVRNVNGDALTILQHYSWPGNVRELQHSIEYAINILPDDVSMIEPKYLPKKILESANYNNIEETASSVQQININPNSSLNSIVKDVEQDTIRRVLAETHGNVSKSARILKMSRQNLQYRIKRFDINVSLYKKNDNIAQSSENSSDQSIK